jgi:hypothetical protein
MPNWYPSYTTCSQPGSWYQLTQTNAGIFATIAAVGIGGVVGLLASSVLPGVGAGLAAACLVGVYYCTWWLSIRLICLGQSSPQDLGALGVIFNTEPPTPSLGFWNLGDYDNDYSFNLLIYPAVPSDLLPNDFVVQFILSTICPETSPPQLWSPAATANLQSEWPALFPTVSFDDANIFLPQQTMASLALGFTGQFSEYTGNLGDPSQLPLMSISVTPATVSVQNGETVQFIAAGLRADGTAENLTQGPDAVTWSVSGSSACATIDSGGFATADCTKTGTVEIIATDQTGTVTGVAHMTTTPLNPPFVQGAREQFLIHCEIEGQGMINLRTFLIALAVAFAAVAVFSCFPPWGTVVAVVLLLLILLALLFGGPAIQENGGGNPPGGAPASSPGFPYVDAPSPDSMVNIVYVYGRWVFDSLHQPAGSNELHPVHFVCQICQVPQSDITAGNWPTSTLAGLKAKYDTACDAINQPSTSATQALPQNQWSLHPLLDGCVAGSGYPPPPPPK